MGRDSRLRQSGIRPPGRPTAQFQCAAWGNGQVTWSGNEKLVEMIVDAWKRDRERLRAEAPPTQISDGKSDSSSPSPSGAEVPSVPPR